jgi:predicted Fe-Mo cluster-binding NifX family protein
MSRRIAISVKSMDGLDSLMDPKFGRAHAFLIVGLENKEIIAQFFNNAASAATGAGTAASVAMNTNDVDVVISGRFGPKAYQSLEAFGVEMWIAPEGITAMDALEQFAAGRLKQMKIKVY